MTTTERRQLVETLLAISRAPNGKWQKLVVLLSGGGALGAFQAGVLRALQDGIDDGVTDRPSHAVGISVGALNAAIMAMWPDDLRNASLRWWKDIRKPSDIAIRKNTFTRVLPGLIRGRFDGLVDPSPLQGMMDRHLDINALRASPIVPHAGAVNVDTGELKFRTPNHHGFLQHLMASASIPAIFPAVLAHDGPWVDGGLVEVAPASRCIDLGADHILAILCQPEDMQRQPIDHRDPWALAERIMDISTTASLEKDVRAIEGVNDRLRQAEAAVQWEAQTQRLGPGGISHYRERIMRDRGLTGRRIIRTTVLRPSRPLGYTTGEFTEGDIEDALAHGFEVGTTFVENEGQSHQPTRRQ